MPTGVQVVSKAIEACNIPGVRYGSWDCYDRCNPDKSHCMDCSGLVSWTLNRLGLNEGCTGSFQQSIECHQAGTGMPIDEAFRTPGALLFQGIHEGQGGIPGTDPGHVGFSAGDNVHSIEARGHWSGVGVFLARSLVWAYAAMPRGVQNTTTIPQPPPPGPQPAPVPIPPLTMGENMTMLALPPTKYTPKGQIPTAIAVRNFNFVLLESGARLIGDQPVAPGSGDHTRHWWAPPASAQVPGWQIQDIADLRYGAHPEQAIVVSYANPDGSRAGTYKAQIAV